MAEIKASLRLDPEKGTATVVLQPVGTTELEHELLAQFFTGRSVSMVPFRAGDVLECRFVISDPEAFKRGQRALENRIRVRNGLPTVEQEQARTPAAKAPAPSSAKAPAAAPVDGKPPETVN